MYSNDALLYYSLNTFKPECQFQQNSAQYQVLLAVWIWKLRNLRTAQWNRSPGNTQDETGQKLTLPAYLKQQLSFRHHDVPAATHSRLHQLHSRLVTYNHVSASSHHCIALVSNLTTNLIKTNQYNLKHTPKERMKISKYLLQQHTTNRFNNHMWFTMNHMWLFWKHVSSLKKRTFSTTTSESLGLFQIWYALVMICQVQILIENELLTLLSTARVTVSLWICEHQQP